MIDSSLLDLWEQPTRAFLASQGWHPGGACLLLAVSGGADSIALFHWALRSAAATGGRLAVAHVHHGLRPSADSEREFVAGLCRERGIPFHACALDPASRRPRESMEMWARRERYAFFTRAAAEAGTEWILTGHHRDDLVETLFQRLGRGTGPRGLQGIPFRRGPIVRPFLNRSRAEILEYLRLCGAVWREDESNADIRIDRNRYRHRILPALRHGEPDLDARMFALAMSVQALGDGIDKLAAEPGWLLREADGRPFLSRVGMAQGMADEDDESVAFWLRQLLGATHPVTKGILRELRRQWASGPAGLLVPITAERALQGGNEGVYLVHTAEATPKGLRRAKKGCLSPAQRVILDEGCGEVSWSWGDRTYSLVARRFPRPEGLGFPEPGGERAIFDADLFSCTLQVRTRQDGDRFSPLGLQSRSRKLKSFFNEEKVPIGIREKLPLVLSGETVAWVPGYGISDFFKVSGSTSHILELVLTCETL